MHLSPDEENRIVVITNETTMMVHFSFVCARAKIVIETEKLKCDRNADY